MSISFYSRRSIHASGVDLFLQGRHLIPPLPLCPDKDTFCANRLPRGIVTTSNFARRWTGRASCYSPWNRSNGASLRFEPIESNLHVRSLVHPQTSSIARGYENDSQVPVFTRVVQLSSKLRRVYDCVSMRDQCGGKKRLLLCETSRSKVLARYREDGNIHPLCSVIRCIWSYSVYRIYIVFYLI